MSLKILATGSCLPEYVLTNEHLSQMMDTSDEWITLRTGIKERRIITTESLEQLAVSAAQRALKKGNLSAEDIDLIICATVHGEYACPALSCLIQAGIGATCPAFDINAACTGFLYAMDISKAYIESGIANKILIVAAEAFSEIIDYTDRATAVLFGDGAGAVIVGKGESLKALKITAKGSAQHLTIGNSKGNCPLKEKNEYTYLHMNGQEVYKFAVQTIPKDVDDVLNRANLKIEDIDYFLIHQANARIIETARLKLNIPEEKILKNIERYGNTSAVCIPLLLDEYLNNGTIKKGATLLLSAFGGGMTTGAAILKIN